MKTLNFKDILALGFLTFAFFVGAGNIIFPPMVGLSAGHHVWLAAIGFIVTAVGLPVLTIIALARQGGLMENLTRPLGKATGITLTVICYLLVGPLYAIPRTTTVSYEMSMFHFFGNSHVYLFFFSLVYFVIVVVVALYPGRILDTIGKILAPIKIVALAILGICACLYSAGPIGEATGPYIQQPVSQGIVDGYLTMDTIGALIFGIVIVNAIRTRRVSSPQLIRRYACIAAVMAGIGLMLVYISLFLLGAESRSIAMHAENGAAVLHAYVFMMLGTKGTIFLACLMTIACLVTAIGLSIACAEYFSQLIGGTYKKWLIGVGLVSLSISNVGLNILITISLPMLTAIYPPCIVLVLLSFMHQYWLKERRVVWSVMGVAFLFGIIDALKNTGLKLFEFAWMHVLPMQDQGLSWIVPVLVTFGLAVVADRLLGKDKILQLKEQP